MTQRERMLRTLRFEPTDRIPLIEWPIRKATATAWAQQGLREGVTIARFFGLDEYALPYPVEAGMFPLFEPVVLETTPRYKIWIDELGATRKDFIEDETPGFVTRSWLRFPVENRADFQEMKKRYDPNDPGRFPAPWQPIASALNHSGVATHLAIPSFFWAARDWMGFENLCTAFYDEPALIEEMFEFLCDFIIALLSRVIGDAAPDMVELKEDMAYKHAPMISPAMVRRFMLPQYRRLVDFLKRSGVKMVFVDCDGYPGDGLMEAWLEAGIGGLSPVEIAAGNDVHQLMRDFPRCVFWGGIDKRVLIRGRQETYDEIIGKVPAMFERGGWIPHIDHAIPADAKFTNYIYMREIIECLVSGRAVPNP